MPQLNIADFAPQLVWLAISFIFLYVMMARVAIPRISQVLEERQGRIAHDLDEAERLKKETDLAIAEYETALAEARSKASGIVAELRSEVDAQQEGRKAELEAKLTAQTKDAEAQISAAKDAALANVREIALDTTKLVVSKIIGVEASEAAVGAAVEAELKGGN